MTVSSRNIYKISIAAAAICIFFAIILDLYDLWLANHSYWVWIFLSANLVGLIFLVIAGFAFVYSYNDHQRAIHFIAFGII